MPHRRFAAGKLVVASHNEGKVKEIRALLEPFGVETVSAAELDLPEPEETEKTFKGNAELKALAAARAADMPALSDDSGLAVDILDGEPGIYSARWAETGEGRDFGVAMTRVEKEMCEKNGGPEGNRKARFICALTLAWADGHVETFEGSVAGALVWPGRGTRGFGYDPVFQPDGHKITFGEMDPAAKHAISHRAHAFEQLIDACFARKS
ncbi:RdgB/HAM1 family non-canonical purine NTP pyrophosphatase [Pyruvatibacter sp. HU-CL02332]|uniref:RdgB/HAM1 family non-canonical purine NTP pyrophosphatase n=1 Tax=Pyruvatibacter sp. HU-CL02332 TaxID=3127650 RepID=UPI0031076E83